MAPSPPATTDGSKTWTPSHLFFDTHTSNHNVANPEEIWARIHAHLKANEFKAAVTTAFQLPRSDSFTYHASASVNLAQAEAAIHAGRANGLHAWYIEPVPVPVHTGETGTGTERSADAGGDDEGISKEENSSSLPSTSLRIAGYPPPADIHAYISLFDPTKAAANSLKSLAANAKKGSLRAGVAEYLLSKRHLDASITVPKLKISNRSNTTTSASPPAQQQNQSQGHENPALDFWAYSCMALEYAGPNAQTSLVRSSHHLLPVYMHHFGCVVPSWESLQIIAKLATTAPGKRTAKSGGGPRSIIDMGSGNGYWTLMLRRLLGASTDVVAVDNAQSRWRTTWIPDTIVTDGVQYLRRRSGCPDSLLLLVYPVVGEGGAGEFTRKVLEAFTGDIVCVAGTQNGNGYTGFKDMTIDEYMDSDSPETGRGEGQWEKVAQVPLPSFAGKDDALFAFRRRK